MKTLVGFLGIINYRVVWEDRIRTSAMGVGFIATVVAMLFLATWLHFELKWRATYLCVAITAVLLAVGVWFMAIGYGYFDIDWLVKLLKK